MDIRVAAYGVILRGDMILLAHWREEDRSGWTLPGGGLEEGEDPADAAIREIFEETGYTAELDELIGIDSIVIPAENRLHDRTEALHALRIVYRAEVTGGELTNEADGSTDEARWVRLAEVSKLDTVELVEIAVRMLVESAR
jgi:ADP-ribose pyrophosphatase YjhB (NUDIX family)